MAERSWWRRLDGQPPWSNPSWWDSFLARAGFIFSIVWGGGFVLRVLLPDKVGGGAARYAALTLISLAVFVLGVAQATRKRSRK